MAVKWYAFLAVCLTRMNVCHPQFTCSSQADCYSRDITTSFRPLVESILECRSGECVCNLCFERKFVLIGLDYCSLSSGCWQFVDHNATHQTCRRNTDGEARVSLLEAPTGVLFGGLGLCAVVGITAYFLWKWCASRDVPFFVRHKGFALLFTIIYFASLAVVLGVCGIGVAITLGVVKSSSCITEVSDDDDNDDF